MCLFDPFLHLYQYRILYHTNMGWSIFFYDYSVLITDLSIAFTVLSYYYGTMDYSVNDRMKEVRQALKLSIKAFATGIHLKSGGYYGDIETHRNKVNERVIELVCSVYGVNKEWLKTGNGPMFSDKKIDTDLEQMTILFNQLNPHFKGYVLTQIKHLIKLQNTKDTE